MENVFGTLQVGDTTTHLTVARGEFKNSNHELTAVRNFNLDSQEEVIEAAGLEILLLPSSEKGIEGVAFRVQEGTTGILTHNEHFAIAIERKPIKSFSAYIPQQEYNGLDKVFVRAAD